MPTCLRGASFLRHSVHTVRICFRQSTVFSCASFAVALIAIAASINKILTSLLVYRTLISQTASVCEHFITLNVLCGFNKEYIC